MIIDTHCHYNLPPLSENWQSHWKKAQEFGVKKSIVVGTSVETSQLAIHIAQQEKNLFCTIGIHPHVYQDAIEEGSLTDITEQYSQLESLMSQPKIVAIGEAGLDYFHLENTSRRNEIIELQKSGLRMQISLAKKFQKILILHVRDKSEQAYWDILGILKEEKFSGTFVLHCVFGPIAYLKEALHRGAYVGVAGNVTYKSAEAIRNLVRATSFDHLLLETDAPYLPPTQYRGQVCEPWMISQTAAFLQKELSIESEQLALNASSLFKLI